MRVNDFCSLNLLYCTCVRRASCKECQSLTPLPTAEGIPKMGGTQEAILERGRGNEKKVRVSVKSAPAEMPARRLASEIEKVCDRHFSTEADLRAQLTTKLCLPAILEHESEVPARPTPRQGSHVLAATELPPGSAHGPAFFGSHSPWKPAGSVSGARQRASSARLRASST